MALQVVLDTCVIVSGLRSRRGASYAILEQLGTGPFETSTSVALALEYEDVLGRTGTGIALTAPEVDRILDYYLQLTRLVQIHYQCRPCLADANDDMVLEAAVNSFSDGIVTHNVRDFQGAARFGLAVWKPADFLRLLQGTNP